MSFTPSQTIADRYLTGCVKQNAKDRRQEPETQLVNDKEYYRKVKISKNDHARAYIDKLKHTNKGFHFFVSERRIFEGQPINRAILTHPEAIVIQHNISDTTPRKRKYLEQLLQDLRRQYPEAKEVINEDRKNRNLGFVVPNAKDRKILINDILKKSFDENLFDFGEKKDKKRLLFIDDISKYKEENKRNILINALYKVVTLSHHVELEISDNYWYYQKTTETEYPQKHYGDLINRLSGGYTRFPDGGKYNTYTVIFIMEKEKITRVQEKNYNKKGELILNDDGLPKKQQITYTRETIFWHELGLLNRKNPCFAIMLENVYRKMKGLPLRYYDSAHKCSKEVSISVAVLQQIQEIKDKK